MYPHEVGCIKVRVSILSPADLRDNVAVFINVNMVGGAPLQLLPSSFCGIFHNVNVKKVM